MHLWRTHTHTHTKHMNMCNAHLSTSHVSIGCFPKREHLPQGYAIAPHITGMRECAKIDGLWRIPIWKPNQAHTRSCEVLFKYCTHTHTLAHTHLHTHTHTCTHMHTHLHTCTHTHTHACTVYIQKLSCECTQCNIRVELNLPTWLGTANLIWGSVTLDLRVWGLD